MTRALFLYTELAAYFHACVEKLTATYEVEAKIFMWPVNKQAPFKFVSEGPISIDEKDDYTGTQLLQACKDFQPDIVFVSGWIDKEYLKVARYFTKQGIPVICGMDNQWFGRLKQRLASVIGPFILPRYYSHIWVPGLFQYEYARRLGFGRERILTGLYSADHGRFFQAHLQFKEAKKENYPHNFIYVGRLSPEKGSLNLYRAFNELLQEGYTNWKLIFIGTGPEGTYMEASDHIEMHGFIKPKELPTLAAEGGCLVFPSLRDAWGVSIHEFAAAGLPMVITDAAGAITAFVRNGYNGYTFQRGNEHSLKNALKQMMNHTDIELMEMGKRSAELSLQITPESWAANFMSIING